MASGFGELSVEDLIQKADGRDCAYRVILNGTQAEAMLKVDENVCLPTGG